MSLYLIGDVQGCDDALARLLSTLDFSPSRDTIYLLGDLVNRGPQSAQVLRRLMGYGSAAQCLLGNHDLSLLAVASGHRAPHRNDTMDSVLLAPDRAEMLFWLRHQKMAMHAHGMLMVHGGLLPQWDVQTVMRLAAEVEQVLRSDALPDFLAVMFGNEPSHWSESLTGHDRTRVLVNALTRLRFCTPEGVMDLKTSGGLSATPPGYLPWFEVPGRKSADVPVAFGHWSTLGFVERPNLVSLDTGCVWGGCLSAMEIGTRRLVQVDCEQAQRPGE